MNLTHLRCLLLRVLLFGFYVLTFPNLLRSQYSEELAKIEHEIERGTLRKAEAHLLRLKQTHQESSKKDYHTTKLLLKIKCFDQDFFPYLRYSEKLVSIARKLKPIHLSEAYAYKAYYWHFMMWPDSALYYADKSFMLLNKNRQDFSEIDPAFVYEIFAITYLYRKDKVKIKAYRGLGLSDSQQKQFFYFDSCEIIQHQYPFKFSSEKAMFYRSFGNRHLDLVSSYRICTKDETRNFNKKQWYGTKRAIELYDKGLKCIKSYHKNDFLALTALKGLNYTLIGEWGISAKIYDSAYKTISIYELMDRECVSYMPLKIFLSFKIKNDILLPYNREKVKRDIYILNKLKKEFWGSLRTECNMPYDPYRLSPYNDLFTLLYFQSLNENNNKQLKYSAVSNLLTMKAYFHFIEKLKHDRKNKLPYFSVRKMQNKLKPGEAYLLYPNDADYLSNQKILITNNKIHFVHVGHKSNLTIESLEEINFHDFKKQAIEGFQNNFEDVLKNEPSLKKIYICYDDPTPYEILIPNVKGENYSELNYLGQTINFVRIYNPVTFFTSSFETEYRKMDVRYVEQKNTSKLLFTFDFFNRTNQLPFLTFEKYQGDIQNLLQQRGILHLFGHGNLNLDQASSVKRFQWEFLKNRKENGASFVKGVNDNLAVSRELVVLNHCYSGYLDYNLNEFNKNISLHILNKGSKTVITSPNVVDDYYSSEFFRLFYRRILNHEYFEDAFYRARKDFFTKHPEMLNPKNLMGLQIMASYPVKYVDNSTNLVVIFLAVLIAIDLFLTVLGAWMRKMRLIDQTNYKVP